MPPLKTSRVLVDSRQYRFGYWIHAASDLPSDFPLPVTEAERLLVAFIPGDTDSLWHRPEYPPHIFVLTADALAVYSHPSAQEKSVCLSLAELLEIDLQEALLYGAIRFRTQNASHCFRYKTLDQKHINEFLRALRRNWLPTGKLDSPSMPVERPENIALWRCWTALQSELDPGEFVEKICTQPPVARRKRTWYGKSLSPSPAFILAVTNQRIVEFVTGSGKVHDPHDLVIRYAPVGNAEGAEIEANADGFSLALRFAGSIAWTLSFTNDRRDAVEEVLALLRR